MEDVIEVTDADIVSSSGISADVVLEVGAIAITALFFPAIVKFSLLGTLVLIAGEKLVEMSNK
jgi:hypothetical protein